MIPLLKARELRFVEVTIRYVADSGLNPELPGSRMDTLNYDHILNYFSTGDLGPPWGVSRGSLREVWVSDGILLSGLCSLNTIILQRGKLRQTVVKVPCSRSHSKLMMESECELMTPLVSCPLC